MRKGSRAGIVALVTVALGAATGTSSSEPAGPTYISPPGHNVDVFALAAGTAGRGVVMWVAADKQDVLRTWVTDRHPGGSFGPPIALSDPDRSSWLPRAVVLPDGTELVGWVESQRNSPWTRVVVATRRLGAPSFTRKRLARVREPSYLRLAAGVDGTAAASWVQDTKDFVGRAVVAIRGPAGVWHKPEILTDRKRSVSNPTVALDGSGNATVVWGRAPPPNKAIVERVRAARRKGQAQVRVAVRPHGGRFGKSQVVSNPHHQATDASLAENASGDAAVVWRTLPSQREGRGFRVSFAYRHGDGHFGKRHTLGMLTSLSLPRAAVAPSGAVSVVWGSSTNQVEDICECSQILVARRPPGGPVGKPIALSEHRTIGPEFTADSAGNALVLWTPDSLFHEYQSRVEGRFVAADGTLGAPRAFSGFGEGIDGSEAGALADDGSALVGWHHYDEGHHRLEVLETTVP